MTQPRVSNSWTRDEAVFIDRVCKVLLAGGDTRVLVRSAEFASLARKCSSMAKLARGERQPKWSWSHETSAQRRKDADDRVMEGIAAGAVSRARIANVCGMSERTVRRALERLSAANRIDYRAHRGWRILTEERAAVEAVHAAE